LTPSDEGVLADGGLDAADIAVAEVFEVGGEPFVLAVRQHGLQGAGEAGEVLAGEDPAAELQQPGPQDRLGRLQAGVAASQDPGRLASQPP
jgi:hypothetical protein